MSDIQNWHSLHGLSLALFAVKFQGPSMIWVVRQFITHQILEVGGERVRFPIRVEVEYPQEKRDISAGSLPKRILYNKAYLLKRYPELREQDLDLLVEEAVRKAIHEHLIVS
jgi:hypothetical protein